jgi:hypothetical protein
VRKPAMRPTTNHAKSPMSATPSTRICGPRPLPVDSHSATCRNPVATVRTHHHPSHAGSHGVVIVRSLPPALRCRRDCPRSQRSERIRFPDTSRSVRECRRATALVKRFGSFDRTPQIHTAGCSIFIPNELLSNQAVERGFEKITSTPPAAASRDFLARFGPRSRCERLRDAAIPE